MSLILVRRVAISEFDVLGLLNEGYAVRIGQRKHHNAIVFVCEVWQCLAPGAPVAVD